MPTLQIDVEARFAKINDGFDKLNSRVTRSVSQMNKSFSTLGVTAARLTGVLAGVALGGGIKSVIDDLDKLNLVSQRTGISVTALNGLAFAARQNGVDFEVLAKGVNKLNVEMSTLATGGNDKLKDLFTQLGLKDLATGAVTGQQALLRLAEVFPRLSEIDQARVSAEAFGEKIGAQLVPALANGRVQFEQFIDRGNKLFPAVTALAKAADDFNDSMAALGLILKATVLPVLELLLPKFNELAENIIAAKEAGLGSLDLLPYEINSKQITKLKNELIDLRKEQAAFDAEASKSSDFFAKAKSIFAGGPRDVKALIPSREKALAALEPAVDKREKAIVKASADKQQPKIKLSPVLDAGKQNQTAKKILDEKLKALQRDADAERELAQTRNDFLQRFYQDDLVSLSDYVNARKTILDQSVIGQTRAIDAEIALLKKSRSSQDGAGRIETDTKINELIEKRKKLQLDANIEGQKIFLDNIKAAEEFANKLQDINTQLLEFQGHSATAALIRFDEANSGLSKRLNAEAAGGSSQASRDSATQGLIRLARLRELTVAQAKLNVLEDEAGIKRTNASAAEDRAQIAAQVGATSEYESLQRIGTIRQQEVVDLTNILNKYEAIAKASDDKRMLQNTEALRLEIEKLSASADVLGDKLRSAFSDFTSSAIQKLLTGTGSLKDRLKSIFNDLSSTLTKKFADTISDEFFSKQGGGNGIVDFFKGILGGKTNSPVGITPTGSTTGSAIGAVAALASGGASASGGTGASTKQDTTAQTVTALGNLTQSTTATSFALREFSDNGINNATNLLVENVTAGVAEQTVTETTSAALASLSVSAELASAALTQVATSAATSSAASGFTGLAEGGLITGGGTGTSDSIPAMLSNNEYVVQSEKVRQPGALRFLEKFNRVGMAALKHFADGGLVTGNGTRIGNQSVPVVTAGYGMTLYQNFTVPQGTPRETQNQIANAALQGGLRARNRLR